MAGILDSLTRLFRGPQVAEEPTASGPVSYELAVQEDPNDPQAWFNLGSYHRIRGDPFKAADALERAVSLRPEFPDARYMLALSYADQGKGEEAIELLEEVARSTDNHMLNEYARRKVEELRGAKQSA